MLSPVMPGPSNMPTWMWLVCSMVSLKVKASRCPAKTQAAGQHRRAQTNKSTTEPQAKRGTSSLLAQQDCCYGVTRNAGWWAARRQQPSHIVQQPASCPASCA